MEALETSTLLLTGFLDEKSTADNFLVELLHKQKLWNPIIAAANDADQAKKALLTRDARLSGVLSSLKIEGTDLSNPENLKDKLVGAGGWIALNVPKTQLKDYARVAEETGLKRLIMVSKFSREEAKAPDIQAVTETLRKSGMNYTLIRVDGVVDGLEGGKYLVLNLTQPAFEDENFVKPVKRGNLARVIAEGLTLEAARQKEVAVLGPDPLAEVFINSVRSRGYARRAEVKAFFDGNFQFAYRRMGVAVQKTPEIKADKEEAKQKLNQEEKDLKDLAASFQENLRTREETQQSRVAEQAHAMAVSLYGDFFDAGLTDKSEREFGQTFRTLPPIEAAAKQLVEYVDQSYFLFYMLNVFNTTVEAFESKHEKLAWCPTNAEQLLTQEWTKKELGAWMRENDVHPYLRFPHIITRDDVLEHIKEAMIADPDLCASEDPSNYNVYKRYFES